MQMWCSKIQFKSKVEWQQMLVQALKSQITLYVSKRLHLESCCMDCENARYLPIRDSVNNCDYFTCLFIAHRSITGSC